MLVLSRRIGEEIVIGEDVRIAITAVKGNRVRVGISAPASVCVDRAEVRDRKAEFTVPEPMALKCGS
jgi:carbon storage regulator